MTSSKFDLKGMVSSVKAIINPNAKLPTEIEGDPIGQKIIEIVKYLEALKESHEKMTEELTSLDHAVGSLSQQLIATKKTQIGENKTTATPSTTSETKETQTTKEKSSGSSESK